MLSLFHLEGDNLKVSLSYFYLSILKIFTYLYFLCMVVLASSMSVPYMHSWCLQRPEEAISVPMNGVIDGFCHHSGAGNQTQTFEEH